MVARHGRRPVRPAILSIALVLVIFGALSSARAQSGVNPLALFQNYFVTGDYVVGGWVEGPADGSGFAPGTISIPDGLQNAPQGVPTSVPKGADIVAAYLYWATVESGTSFAGQKAYFNGYPITGTVLGNPNAPTSWSAGGCSGSAQGSKTMRTYRADVHPFLPLDTNPQSLTYGTKVVDTTVNNGPIKVRLRDSGSNGNTAPFALGATLVLIYRVLAPATVPLNAIVIYDGAFAPSNASQTMSQMLSGFYQPSTSPIAKITHIVANGQTNKRQNVYLNSTAQPLPSLYGALPPFPGVYPWASGPNSSSYTGSWDNPTWLLNNYVKNIDTSETTSVVPVSNSKGCVSWGTVIMSTSVQSSKGDGLLDVWKQNEGYTDAVTGQWVPLPKASLSYQDLYVELDYLSNLDGGDGAGSYLHSHLPKRDAIDAVGSAFANKNINVHFDLGPGIYPNDPYVISYPIDISKAPPGTQAPPQGGNAISEGKLLCVDGATLCAYPGQPAVGWKGGFEAVKNTSTLGNFQSGRAKSYHYVLFGHSLGSPRSYWGTIGSAIADPRIPQLLSIVDTGNTATIKIQSTPGLVRPGDCANASLAGCTDASSNRVTISGALNQVGLNGTYIFSNPVSTTVNNVSTTTFTVTTSGVTDGTYNFANEPQLAVTYLGPSSSSGQSEFGGGGDSTVTLGLWGADDPANCQADPSQTLLAGQVYCSNFVGTIPAQTGTLMHELGHSLALTHGGTYFNDPDTNPSLPTREVNCKSNFLSVMNYLFQVRGFVDGGFDYSSQTIASLNEALLDESKGIGANAAHLTRWYAPPNAFELQTKSYAKSHCDGSPLGPNDVPAIRVNASVAPGGSLDFNHNGIVPDAVTPPGIDLNYNGVKGDAPFSGYNDWETLNFQQIGARENALGFSGGGVNFSGGGVNFSGGGVNFSGGGVNFSGGGVDNDGGGVNFSGGGVNFSGGGVNFSGGGIDQSEDAATSTTDPPTSLICTVIVNGVPACVPNSGIMVESGTKVPLKWTGPGFGQIRNYTIWRATGSFPTTAALLPNLSKFTVLTTLTGAPPSNSYVDAAVKNNTTYTYFVTDGNKQGVQSGTSNLLVVSVKK